MLASAILLIYGNVIFSAPGAARDGARIVANLGLTAAALGMAYASGLTRAELGLKSRPLVRSSLIGIAIGLALPLPVVALVGIVPLVTGQPVQYAGVGELTGGQLAVSLGLRFPLGTALAEEVIFRGVLLALWRRAAGARRAVIATAVTFALWHAVVVNVTVQDSGLAGHPFLFALGYVGALLAILVVGVVLAVLQVRSRSVAGPVMAHWLTVALIRLAIGARD